MPAQWRTHNTRCFLLLFWLLFACQCLLKLSMLNGFSREARASGDEKMIPRAVPYVQRFTSGDQSISEASISPEKPLLRCSRRLYAHSRRIIPPPSKIIFCVPCAIKIGESNKLGRQGIRFIVSLAAISELFVRSNEEWAPSTWSKNHKTQFTMANAKKRRKRRRGSNIRKYEIYGCHIPQARRLAGNALESLLIEHKYPRARSPSRKKQNE